MHTQVAAARLKEHDAVASAMQANHQAGITGQGRQVQTQGSKWKRYDKAIAALAQTAAAAQVPGQPGLPPAGRCYGRLCNIVCVRQNSMTCAANAAVAELLNLGTCVFVSDRQIANTVGDKKVQLPTAVVLSSELSQHLL